MTLLRREGKKQLETVPVVPWPLLTPERTPAWEPCLGRHMEWDQAELDAGTQGQKPGSQVLRHINILDTQHP